MFVCLCVSTIYRTKYHVGLLSTLPQSHVNPLMWKWTVLTARDDSNE